MIILLAIWCQQSPTRHKSKIAFLAFSFGNYPENSLKFPDAVTNNFIKISSSVDCTEIYYCVWQKQDFV